MFVGVVVVVVNRCVRRSAGKLEAPGDTAEGFRRAPEGIGGGAVTHLLPFHGILLVRELECGVRDSRDGAFVIQRCRGCVVDSTSDGEVDVFEEEGLRSGFRVGRFEIFCRTEEPEEGNDDEVNDVAFSLAFEGVFGVECVKEVADDGEVGRVGACGRRVFIVECFEESFE